MIYCALEESIQEHTGLYYKVCLIISHIYDVQKSTILAKNTHEIMGTVAEKRSLFSCAKTVQSGLQKVRISKHPIYKMSNFQNVLTSKYYETFVFNPHKNGPLGALM